MASKSLPKTYDCTVLKLVDFSESIYVKPGKDALKNILQIANRCVNAAIDCVREGRQVRVKIFEAEERGH